MEKHDERANAPGHAQGQGRDGDADVVLHQVNGKGCLLTGQPVGCAAFLPRHPFAGVAEVIGELGRQHRGFGFGVERQGQGAEGAASQGDRHGQPERVEMPAKGLRQGSKEPGPWGKRVPFSARFMNLTVGPGHQMLQVAA